MLLLSLRLATLLWRCPGLQLLRLCRPVTRLRLILTARILRAWKAGQWAGAVLQGLVTTPNRATRHHVVSQAAGISEPVCYSTSHSYWRLIRSFQQNEEAISHSFPSQSQGKAGVPYPTAPGVMASLEDAEEVIADDPPMTLDQLSPVTESVMLYTAEWGFPEELDGEAEATCQWWWSIFI